jgi:tRNA(Arg) A34 adenosine deaminase TadA
VRWSDLEPPWQTCVELAVEAYGRGTTPVGAVIVDGSGREVARGRNARYHQRETGELAGSHVAHAELAALAHLSSEHSYPDHTLFTSLEPCAMCAGAAHMSMVGRVCYAGGDPYGGAARLMDAGNAHLDRGLTSIEGPADGALGLFCAALHVEFYLRRNPAGHVVAAYRTGAPPTLEAAAVLAALDAPRRAAAPDSARAIFDAFAGRLDNLST